MNLSGLWRNSYFPQVNPLTPWQPGEPFDDWWAEAKHDFDDARATSFYRYQLPAFRDLYGVDFDRITDEQAADLDARIFDNYRDERWLHEVVTERANIELMFNDPYWGRFDFKHRLPVRGAGLQRHDAARRLPPLRVQAARRRPVPLRAATTACRSRRSTTTWRCSTGSSARPRPKGAVCLKTTLAYQRTLRFENVPEGAGRARLRPAPGAS